MTVPVHAGRSASKAKRRMIGWDEILHGALPFPDSTVVMSWQGYIQGLDMAYNIYSYNTTSGLDEQYHMYIIGMQGNSWTEYVWEREDLEWKLFPRILAVAEIGWTQNEVKNWPRFLSNYAVHQKEVLKYMAVVDAGFQLGTIVQWKSGDLKSDKWVSVEFPLDGAVEATFVYTGGND
ncbi:hypothetical protein M9Y10_039425 [Tritrichomonas musculus]|uniref:beta-N-acetylhexosaminidase n=1 Tax=Tritrichomonas musculus TaxID=1915356 RepID=A0ABR2KBV2_9EUKA